MDDGAVLASLRARPPPGAGAGPSESAGWPRDGRESPGPSLRFLRRAVSAAGSPCHDHCRARGLPERDARDRVRPDPRADGRVATHHELGGHGAALGGPVPQYADAGYGARLSRRLPDRGHQPVRGTGHDAPVRAGRRALPRRAALGERPDAPGYARRDLPSRRLSARLPQVHGAALPGRPAPRHRRQALRDLPRADHRGPPPVAALSLAAPTLRVRAKAAAHRSAVRGRCHPPRHRARAPAPAPRALVAPGPDSLRPRPPALPALSMMRSPLPLLRVPGAARLRRRTLP